MGYQCVLTDPHSVIILFLLLICAHVKDAAGQLSYLGQQQGSYQFVTETSWNKKVKCHNWNNNNNVIKTQR